MSAPLHLLHSTKLNYLMSKNYDTPHYSISNIFFSFTPTIFSSAQFSKPTTYVLP